MRKDEGLGFKKKFSFLVFLITFLSCFSTVFITFSHTARADDNWHIVGDKIYIDSANFYVSAEPHTAKASGWVTFEAMLKTSSQEIDFVWGFNSTNGLPKNPQIWRSYQHTKTGFHLVEKSKTMTIYSVTSYQNLGIVNYDNYVVDYGNKNNVYLFKINFTGENGPTSKIIAFSQYSNVGQVYTLTGNQDVMEKYTYQETYEDWDTLPAELFEVIHYNFKEMDTWYLAKNVDLIEDKLYKIRVWIDVPFEGQNVSEGKYFWGMKQSSKTLQQAIADGTFYYIDPWYSAQWQYRKPFWTNSSFVSTNVNDFPFLLHLPSDTDLADDAKCQNLGQDIVITDEDGNIIPFEIEYFDGVTGETNIWIEGNLSSSSNTLFYLYYGNPNATFSENVDDTWNDFYKGTYHLYEGTATYQFDATKGLEPEFIQLSGTYYAVVYTSSTSDAYVKTVNIIKGTITSVDSWLFDTVGTYPEIFHVYGDVYAIVYTDTDSDGWVKTLSINTSGIITKSWIDTEEFETTQATYFSIVKVSSDIWAISYRGPGGDGYVKSIQISSTGQITSPFKDSLEYDATSGSRSSIIKISGDYYTIFYTGPSADGFVKTITIDSAGTISNAVIDTYEFDTADCLDASALWVGNTYYAVAYKKGASGALVVVSINDTGIITNSIIDSLIFYTPTINNPDLHFVYGEIYSIAFQAGTTAGMVETVSISVDGDISNSVISTLTFDATKGATPSQIRLGSDTYPPILFSVAYEGSGTAGYMKTFSIAGDGYIFYLYQDSSGNNNYGIGGGGTQAQMPSTVDGIVFKALSFDGTDDYVLVNDDTSLHIGQKGTLSLWFKLTNIHQSGSSTKRLLGKNNDPGTNGEFALELTSTGQLAGSLYSGTLHTATTSKSSWSAGTWYHAVMTWDTTSSGYGIKIYYNGVQDGSNTDKNYVPNTIGNVFFGMYRDAVKYPFQGIIDEVRIKDMDVPTGYITTSYNTITYQGISDGKFIIFGTEQNYTGYPFPPTDFVAYSYNSSVIYLSWTVGDLSDYTYIRYSNTSYPLNRFDGTFCCNTTSLTFNLEGLDDNTTYYFSAWGYNVTRNQYSLNYSTATATTYPPLIPPTDFTATATSYTTISLTWNIPPTADYAYIRYSNVSYPTIRTGGLLSVNTTGTYYLQTGLTTNVTYYFSAWSYNVTNDAWSYNYSMAYDTTKSSPYIFSNEVPIDGATNIIIFPLLYITVTNMDGNSFNLTWYLTPEFGSEYEVFTVNNIPNGTYTVDLSTFGEGAYGFYGWNYNWHVVATTVNTPDSFESDTYLYQTQTFSYENLGVEVEMNLWMIILWLVIWAILLFVNIRGRSKIFGGFAGMWLFLLGIFIIASGVQIETGTITTIISPSQSVNYIQYTNAILPYSTYSIVWGVFLFVLALYIIIANIRAKASED